MKKFLLIAVLIAFIVGGVLIWKGVGIYRAPERDIKNESTEARNGWKTYAFKGYPFAFDYPESWTVREEAGIAVLTQGLNEESEYIGVDVTGELPYERAVEEIKSGLLIQAVREVQIGSLAGVQLEGILNEDIEAGEKSVTFTMLDYGGRLVSVDYVAGSPEVRNLKDAYQDIVQSLRRVENPI